MQHTPQVVIETKQLHYHFTSHAENNQLHQIDILKSVNLTVYAGETIAIIGSSGSGKSTLLSLLAGLDVPTTGSVHINGHAFSELDEDGRAAVRANSMGFIFQSFQLLPALSAVENVMLPLQLKNIPQAKRLSIEALDQVGLSARAQHYPKQLSGGEQQRVAIARAFATQPNILFADEPTGNLDQATGQMIIDMLFQLNQTRGTTLVLVTHDLALAARCERQLILSQGQLLVQEAVC